MRRAIKLLFRFQDFHFHSNFSHDYFLNQMTLQGFGRRGFGLASRWRVLSLSRDLFSAFNLLSNSFSLFWNEVDILDFDHVTKFVW